MHSTIKSAVLSLKGWLTIFTATVLFSVTANAYQTNSSIGIQDESIKLGALISDALANNPKIQMTELQWESSKMRIPQVGAWMDPKLSFSIMNIPYTDPGFGSDPMTMKNISLTQTIPFPGISGIKKDIARIESKSIEYSIQLERNTITRDISLTFYDYFLNDKSYEITDKNKSILKDFIVISSKKYEVGEGIQQDILQAQVEMSKLMDKLIVFKRKKQILNSEIKVLIGNDEIFEIGKIQDPVHVHRELNTDFLKERAMINNPEILRYAAIVSKNESSYTLSTKQNYPDLTVGFSYAQRDKRRDFIMAQFSINLPIWKDTKQNKLMEESLNNITVMEEMQRNIKNELFGDIEQLVFSLEETDERIKLLKEVIIPQAIQSFNSAMTGYQVNKVDFLTLLTNQVSLFNFELDYFRYLITYKKNIALLEYAIGGQINN